MRSEFDDWTIAVDGGGSTCRLVLERPGALFQVTGGSANASIGFDAAVRNLRDGLARLAAQAGLDSLQTIPAYLGLAGVTDADMAARLAQALPVTHARVEEDRHCAVAGALGPGDGAVALCGTGSFVAVRRAGQTRLAGGWGPVLGDEASAHWLARQGLAAMLAVTDGLAAPSHLSNAMAATVGDRQAVIARSLRGGQSDLAALAPLVTAAAEAGCPTAQAILTDGARYIAGAVTALGWRPDLPLVLTGGVGPAYAPFLPPAAAAAVVAPLGSPLDGARAMARAYARGLRQ